MADDASFLEDQQATIRVCEMVGERWASAVAPVYVESDKRSVTANGVGTMFLGSIGDRILLVTAHHVIERSKTLPYRVVNIQGSPFNTLQLDFIGDHVVDIAVVELNTEKVPALAETRVKCIPLFEDVSDWTPTGIFSLVGYPASKNVLKARFGSVGRHAYNLVATELVEPSRRTNIPSPLALAYSPKRATMGTGERITPPDLHGMSGGPCLEIMLKKTESGLTLRPRLRGVVAEYLPQDRQIIVSPISHIAGLNLGPDPKA